MGEADCSCTAECMFFLKILAEINVQPIAGARSHQQRRDTKGAFVMAATSGTHPDAPFGYKRRRGLARRLCELARPRSMHRHQAPSTRAPTRSLSPLPTRGCYHLLWCGRGTWRHRCASPGPPLQGACLVFLSRPACPLTFRRTNRNPRMDDETKPY